METITLTARARNGTGKSYNRKLRNSGWIPATFYGYGVEALTIEVDYKEFAKLVEQKRHNNFIELKGEGIPGNSVAVVREFDNDPIKLDRYYNIDFQKVVEGRPVTTFAKLNLVGTSEGVIQGGILNQAAYIVRITGAPEHLVRELALDIAPLKAKGDTISATALELPEGVSLAGSQNQVLARLF
ncbi:50S ribosomal protein L25 [Chitinivibrio alkaliphilus]|uniref:Large ribosomal subunit protein bL25 n=1 Tax=Chitinivibrio alkaliphilus ACht1 TaxID=1313304 RepID=U7D7E0_9BACT|nr:50S ribosomal protein L25 [Chitinivibrio alkaliphilus]ERP31496.1 ribosomal protein L25, Ctc-form [Chitinivibrio alkaliphilus ACht1]